MKKELTGAHERKMGLLELAHNGTVFLDEIGELEINLQKKLLRFLPGKRNTKSWRKQQDQPECAGHSRYKQKPGGGSKGKRFREDLFYRLNVVAVKIPSLRERIDDIPLLANHFLEQLNKIEGKLITGFEDNVTDAFSRYDWPGNVRNWRTS